jgi:hypothetical protein
METKLTPVKQAWVELLLLDLLEAIKPEEREEAIQIIRAEHWQTPKGYYKITLH